MRRALLCLCAVVCADAVVYATPVDLTSSASLSVEAGSVSGAPLRSVFDARWADFWAEGVWWQDRSTTLRIDFSTTVELSEIMLQAHEDDAFEFDLLYQGEWSPFWTAEQTAAKNFRALSNVAQTIRSEVFAGTFADAVRIHAAPGLAWDARERFGIAAVAVFGSPLPEECPEPAPLAVAAAALLLLALAVRWKRRKS